VPYSEQGLVEPSAEEPAVHTELFVVALAVEALDYSYSAVLAAEVLQLALDYNFAAQDLTVFASAGVLAVESSQLVPELDQNCQV